MNFVEDYMNKYSKNLNDYGTYLAPLGTMVCSGLGGGINTVSSAISVAINQLGIKTADKLESNKGLVNRSTALFSAIVVTTVAQSYIYGASGNNFAITCLANLGLFMAAYKGVEASNPSRIIPYVRLPVTIGLSCLIGEVARQIFLTLGSSPQDVNQAGGFLTMLAVCSVALNDLFPQKVIVGNSPTDASPKPYILKDIKEEVRQLPSGRVMIVPKKTEASSHGPHPLPLQTQVLPVRTN